MTGWNMPPGLSDAEFDKHHITYDFDDADALEWAMRNEEDFIWSVADNVRELLDEFMNGEPSEADVKVAETLIQWYWKRRGKGICSDYEAFLGERADAERLSRQWG
jgi:hypothetical protein